MNKNQHLVGNVVIIDHEHIKTKTIQLSNQDNLLYSLFGNELDLVHNFQLNYFQKQPVVIRGSNIRIADIQENYLYNFNIKEMLDNTSSDEIQVWLSSFEKTLVETSKNNKINDIVTNTPLDAIKVSTGEQAYKLFKAGHNVYCRAPEDLENVMIPNLLKSLKYGINTDNCHNDRYSRGEIETFFTNVGHKTTFHTDFQENFTIQLHGCKKWSFRKSSLVAPLRGCAPHFSACDLDDVVEQQLKVHKCTNKHFEVSEFQKNNIDMLTDTSNNSKKRKIEDSMDDDLMSVILYPGDVLYHPAGVWHEVECIEPCDRPSIPVYKNKKAKTGPLSSFSEFSQPNTKSKHHSSMSNFTKMYSLAINCSLITTTYAEIVSNAIQQMLWKNSLYRSNVRAINTSSGTSGSGGTSGGTSGYSAHHILRELLDELPVLIQQLSPQDILPKPSMFGIDGGIDGEGGIGGDGGIGAGSDMENDSDVCSNASSQMSDEGILHSEHDENSMGSLSMDSDMGMEEDEGVFHSMRVMLPLPMGQEWLKDWKHTQYEYSHNGICNMEINSHWRRRQTEGPLLLKINPLCSLINCNTECITHYKGYFDKYKSVGSIDCNDTSNTITKPVWQLIENCPKYGTYYQLSLTSDGQIVNYRYDIYSSHCNFGNDALESLSNCYIAIPMEYRKCIQNLEHYQTLIGFSSKDNIHSNTTTNTNTNTNSSNSMKIIDMNHIIKKFKHDMFIKNNDVLLEYCNYLMYCLSEVGYVTEVNN